jgi:hypothetical protein
MTKETEIAEATAARSGNADMVDRQQPGEAWWLGGTAQASRIQAYRVRSVRGSLQLPFS